MEHTSKALIMAFGMLVAVLILATITFVFTNLKVVPIQDDEIDNIEQIRLFNQEYEVYDKKIMYGVDIISLLNKAQSNNEKYVQGKFLNGNFNNTDYIINIVVNFKSELEEEFKVTYLENTVAGVKEMEYTTDEGPDNIKANTVFKAPNSIYQKLIYGNSNKWNNTFYLETKTIKTKVANGADKDHPISYQLLSGAISKPDSNGETHYTNAMLDYTGNPSVLYELLTQSNKMPKIVRNTEENKYGYGEGWNTATWYQAVYDMKLKKFKSESSKITYNPRTSRIVYMEFTEV